MMKKILSVLCVIGVLAGLFAACQNTQNNAPSSQSATSGVTTVSTTAGSSTGISSQTTTVVTAQPSSTTGSTTGTTTTTSTSKPTSKPSGSTTASSVPVTPTTPTTKPAVQLPYQIPNTGLIIEQIGAFDGIYVEDGSNTEISGVAMILLHNRGSKDIDLATITLTYGEFTREFAVSSLPKGMSVVVQEKNRNAMAAGTLTACNASVIECTDEMQLSYREVSVTESTDNSLTFKNETTRDLPSIRVFYKYFMEDQQILVGGITFTLNITDLKAGQSVTVKPAHYLTGASQIVMVQIYEVAA